MLAAEQNQAEQELSKSIRQPRDVRLASSCFNRELSSCGRHLRSFLKPASGMRRAGKNETRFSTKRCSRPFLHNGDVRSVASRRYQPLWLPESNSSGSGTIRDGQRVPTCIVAMACPPPVQLPLRKETRCEVYFSLARYVRCFVCLASFSQCTGSRNRNSVQVGVFGDFKAS